MGDICGNSRPVRLFKLLWLFLFQRWTSSFDITLIIRCWNQVGMSLTIRNFVNDPTMIAYQWKSVATNSSFQQQEFNIQCQKNLRFVQLISVGVIRLIFLRNIVVCIMFRFRAALAHKDVIRTSSTVSGSRELRAIGIFELHTKKKTLFIYFVFFAFLLASHHHQTSKQANTQSTARKESQKDLHSYINETEMKEEEKKVTELWL